MQKSKPNFCLLPCGKIIQGIVYFPYKMLETVEYVMKGRGVTYEMALNVYKKMREYLPEDGVPRTAYQTQIYNKLVALEYFIQDTWGV